MTQKFMTSEEIDHPWDMSGSQKVIRSDAAYACDNCHRINVVTWDVARYAPSMPAPVEPTDNDQCLWSPSPVRSAEYSDVPEHIADAASEASLCLSVGAYRAVGALARAVVEASAKHVGVKDGRIQVKIEKLRELGKIGVNIENAAHEIRYFGNEMAHGDFVTEISGASAREILGFMDELLNEMFQSPARVKRRKEARERKEAESKDIPKELGT